MGYVSKFWYMSAQWFKVTAGILYNYCAYLGPYSDPVKNDQNKHFKVRALSAKNHPFILDEANPKKQNESQIAERDRKRNGIY